MPTGTSWNLLDVVKIRYTEVAEPAQAALATPSARAMDREILLTGMGGQGIQLAAKLIARAAMLEGREAMQFSMFSGTMRGGTSECTVVVADGPVEAPPVVPWAWAAIAMHPTALTPIQAKLRPTGVVLFDRTMLTEPPAGTPSRWFGIDAARIAAERENPAGRSLVAVAAFARLTGLVGRAVLEPALADLLPTYRQQTLAKNVECLRAGWDAAGAIAGRCPAWPGPTAPEAQSPATRGPRPPDDPRTGRSEV